MSVTTKTLVSGGWKRVKSGPYVFYQWPSFGVNYDAKEAIAMYRAGLNRYGKLYPRKRKPQ